MAKTDKNSKKVALKKVDPVKTKKLAVPASKEILAKAAALAKPSGASSLRENFIVHQRPR